MAAQSLRAVKLKKWSDNYFKVHQQILTMTWPKLTSKIRLLGTVYSRAGSGSKKFGYPRLGFGFWHYPIYPNPKIMKSSIPEITRTRDHYPRVPDGFWNSNFLACILNAKKPLYTVLPLTSFVIPWKVHILSAFFQSFNFEGKICWWCLFLTVKPLFSIICITRKPENARNAKPEPEI